jgi:hypothetical protein
LKVLTILSLGSERHEWYELGPPPAGAGAGRAGRGPSPGPPAEAGALSR